MARILNFPSPRVLELMKRLEVEKDRETLQQLFSELTRLLNENERKVQPNKKAARSINPMKSDGTSDEHH